MRTYEVIHSDGSVERMEMSAEMEKTMREIQAWDGWCKCAENEAVIIDVASGDVDCLQCGGTVQVS